MTYKRRLQVAVVAAVCVLAIGAWIGFGMLHRVPSVATDSTSKAGPNIVIAVARTGTYIERIDVQGRIGPPAGSSAKIVFAQPGILQVINVHIGDHVAAGQPVAQLDRSSLAAALAQAEADARSTSASYGGGAVPTAAVNGASARLALAQSKLDTLQRGGPAALSSRIAAASAARQAAIKVTADQSTIARAQLLLAAGVIAQKDLDAARAQIANDEADQRAADARVFAAGADFQTALKQAQADVAGARNDLQGARTQVGVLGGQAASSQARLDGARIAYANGTLRAPLDGIVLAIMKHPGESVDPSQAVMEIGPALGNSVTLSVPADSARRIIVGDAATLRTQNTKEVETHGRVAAVVPAVDPTTQLATVVVSGVPPDTVSGDAVTATIVVGHMRGVLVPSTAIVQDPQSGKTVVFVRDAHPKASESGFSLRQVSVSASDAETALLTSGLQPGEAVAAQGGYSLLAPVGG